MGLQVEHIVNAVHTANLAMTRLEPILNEADALIGDADTGSMLARVIRAMSNATQSHPDDVGMTLTGLARAATSATGSSLGTLLATALLSLGKATKAREDIPWAEFGALLGKAGDAMAARGGAKLGDKTVLDALDAVASALANLDDEAQNLSVTAASAAHSALDRLRSQVCRVGRARMFPQKSSGSDDPGMLAFTLLLDSLIESTSSPTTN